MANHLYDGLFAPHAGSDRTFLILPDGSTVTYSAFLALTARYAHALRAAGLQPGDRVALPEAEGAVRLERRHVGQDATAQHEVRHAPLDGFDDIRAMPVHQFAQVAQDRPGKRLRRLDVPIHPGIQRSHGPCPPPFPKMR